MGLYFFFVGLHNMDLSVNMLKLSYDKDLDFYELGDRYHHTETPIKYVDAYVLATRQVFLGVFLLLIGGIIYGSNFGKIEEILKNESV